MRKRRTPGLAAATRIAASIATAAAITATAAFTATLAAAPTPSAAQQPDEDQDAGLPTIAEKTQGMEKLDGFIPVYWDDAGGKLWLEIGRWNEELLHYTALAAGVGSNDIGLDRGQLGNRYVVQFQRFGPKVLMVEPNYAYRADETDNPDERRAVEEAFARSVIWGFEVAAEEDGRVLVDATEFFIRDAHGVIETLRRTNQGSYSLDESRSAPYRPRTKAFPQNTEVEVTLTYTGNAQHRWIRSVAPSPDAVTVRQHYSFVQLPERGSYTPRRADPRAGYGGVSYLDYTVPLGEPMRRWYVSRHRLEKQNPEAEASPPVEPIVYYLDRGTPEPVRSALLDGARWWNQAFEAAGYQNAFRVEMMPEGADAMDLRYNVIQWVHRSTRGWSYGSSVVDPRTGEILKGHVTLGSLRVRQDYLIAEGLLSPYEEGDEASPAMREMALARIRQLSAHEVGHTLGLAHNYISSAQGPDGRASVMDYPHPLARLGDDGEIDLSQAYDTGIGEWDQVAIRYGYQDFPDDTNEEEALTGILMEAEEDGITFISDQDARPSGSAHPQVHLWDNGRDAAAELSRKMDVRRAALERFGQRAIESGEPLATMEEALVPLYLHHRYQVEAASKVVGGLYYTYALRGDGQEPMSPVPADQQERALDAVLATLTPEALAIPDRVLDQLPPRPFGYGPHRELFSRHTGLVFDAVAPAEVAADMAVSFLLHPERAARLVEQHARNESLPGLEEVLHPLMDATFRAEPESGYHAELNRTAERVVVDRIRFLAEEASMPQVRAVASHTLENLASWLAENMTDGDRADRAHYHLLASEISRFLDRPWEASTPRGPVDAPPGSPIGTDAPESGTTDGRRWSPSGDGTALLPWDAWKLRNERSPGWLGADEGVLYCTW